MHLLATTTSFLLTLLFTLHLATSFPSDDISNLSNCNQTFSCGTLTNVTYPFTGGLRPSHCGLPEFHLTCDNHSVTILTVNSLRYRVNYLDQISQTLGLSRSDFDDNSACTQEYANTTLDDRIFSLVSYHETLSLFYGCKRMYELPPDPKLPNSTFSCDFHGATEEGFFRIFNPIPNTFECRNSIQVPITESQVEQLLDNGSLVGQVLKEGFYVSYSNPYSDDCIARCYMVHSGGNCGFDAQLGKPICICNDHLCPGRPPVTGYSWSGSVTGSSWSGRRLHIGIGISAAVAVIITFSKLCLSRREGSFSAVIAMTFRLKNSEHDDRVATFMMDYHSLTPKRYSYSDIKKMTNSFANILGQGGFGNVSRGKLPDGRLVAVKVLKESRGDGEEFMNEVASISRTSHVNIVTLLGFCYERNRRALIYEFMPNGSLDSFISNKVSPHTNCRLEWKKLYEIAVGIARGLEYLHRGCNTRIVHFDIKPHNILLDEDFCPKISDFGLAKLCKSKVSKVSMIGARGTVGYIAPEVFCRSFGGVTYKSDVYSYGMMVLEMVGQSNDFEMGSLETNEMYFPDWFYLFLEPGEISVLHGGITDQEEEEIVKKMILVGLWCIQTLPSHRPSMTKVVEMFEGSLQSLQIPPRPSLSSPRRSPQEHSSTVSSLPCVSSQGMG